VQLEEPDGSTSMHGAEAALAEESSAGQGEHRSEILEEGSRDERPARSVWRLRWASLAVFTVAMAALGPSTGDFGLTWDDPAYRYSQIMSAQWWEQVGRARSWSEVQEQLDPTTLLYYWPYARHGINFHPPLAGQLNLATYAVLGHWMKDI